MERMIFSEARLTLTFFFNSDPARFVAGQRYASSEIT